MKIADILEKAAGADCFSTPAHEMESKLRTINDMLPEIKTSLRWLINTYEKNSSPVAVEKDLLAKLEKWEDE